MRSPKNLVTLACSLALTTTLGACGAFDPPPATQDMSPASDMDMGAAGPRDDGSTDMPTKRGVGEVCETPNDCLAGASCVSSGRTFRCMLQCEEPGRICADGAVCTSVGQTDAVCYLGASVAPFDACRTNIECAKGHLCFGDERAKFCLPACHELDAVCEQGEVCVTGGGGKGYCRGAVGRSCAQSTDCAGNLYCTTESGDADASFFPAGTCTARCAQDEECGVGAACRDIDGAGTRICLDVCEEDAMCRFNKGESCISPLECALREDTPTCEALTAGKPLCLTLP